jgi:hypothetical protein
MFSCCGSLVLCYAINQGNYYCHVNYGLGMQTLCVVESNDKEWHEDLCLHNMGIQCVEGGSKMEFGNSK